MNWIIENKEWLFSGIGIVLLSLLLKFFLKKRKEKSIKMKQKSGKNSTNIQVGGDYNGK